MRNHSAQHPAANTKRNRYDIKGISLRQGLFYSFNAMLLPIMYCLRASDSVRHFIGMTEVTVRHLVPFLLAYEDKNT